MKSVSILKSTNLILVSFGIAASPALFGTIVISETFEGFELGVQSATSNGTFTIVDGIGTTGSGKAAQIDSNSMQHRFNYNDGETVTTFSFDLFTPSTASGSFLFAINNTGGGLTSGANNITRISIGAGFFGFQPSSLATMTNANYPLNTLVTAHLVLNNSTQGATNSNEQVTLAAKTAQLWTEIGGVFAFAGSSTFALDKQAVNTHGFGIATTGGSNPQGYVVDNIRREPGVTVIPEPSTYALFGGLGVLGFAFIIRRRRSRK
jgi:hypothetical protein